MTSTKTSKNSDHAKNHGDPKPTMHERFRAIARKVSFAVGHPAAFLIAMVGVITWALVGPIFEYSDTWQLVINTSTTIITFLVVFLIQNSQNHDSKVIQLKLDELLRAIKAARNTLVDLEELPDEDLNRLEAEFRKLREQTRANLQPAGSGRH